MDRMQRQTDRRQQTLEEKMNNLLKHKQDEPDDEFDDQQPDQKQKDTIQNQINAILTNQNKMKQQQEEMKDAMNEKF